MLPRDKKVNLSEHKVEVDSPPPPFSFLEKKLYVSQSQALPDTNVIEYVKQSWVSLTQVFNLQSNEFKMEGKKNNQIDQILNQDLTQPIQETWKRNLEKPPLKYSEMGVLKKTKRHQILDWIMQELKWEIVSFTVS